MQNSNAFGQNKFKSGKHKTAITQLQKLTGTWRLIEFADLDSATSKWKYPYVKNPKGYFTYIKSGIVNLNISADTALKISEHSIKNYSINLLNWANNFHYVILELTHLIIINQLTHHVKGGSLPWYIDIDQPTPFVLKGDN